MALNRLINNKIFEMDNFTKDISKRRIELLKKSLPLNDSCLTKFYNAWNKLDDYVHQEQALTVLIDKYRDNTDVSVVLLKCSILNQFYSTRINSKDLITLAKHIVCLNIDAKLEEGDWSVVGDIAKCPGLSNHISFASKYCNWHNQQSYPIYDRYVVDLLCILKDNDELNSFKTKSQIKNEKDINKRYQAFGAALNELAYKKGNVLNFALDKNKNIIYKALDRALWLLAKYYLGDEISVIDIAEAIGAPIMKYIYEKFIIHQSENGAIAVSNEKETDWLDTKNTLQKICTKEGIKYNKETSNPELGQKIIELKNTKQTNK